MATIIDSTGTPASESSALSIIDVTLDIRQNKMVSVLLKQYNKQSQQIKFTVTDNGEKIELKEIEHTVLFKMMTPDGRRVSSYCAINENDHTAVLTVAKNYCSYPGKGTAELEVMDALEESQVGTMNMDVIIENSVYPDEMINGSSTYQGLDEKINAVREACNSAIVVKEETESIRDETETIHDECVVLNNQTAQNTQLANDYANMAQSYANGESGTREREETDNAKYYYNQTSLLKADTETIKTELLKVQEVVNQKASAAESYATNASNSATEAENSASQTSADREVVTALANEVNNKIGSPLTASAASDMTNQNKIYVYTGSEEGYIFGNWYYYDGSTWVSGGVYNSIAFETDKDLIIADMPADAKATGVAIDSLKDDITYKIDKPSINDTNKFPRAKNGNIEWVEQGLPTDEQTAYAVQNWLNDHPEATTTVQDGSLTYKKFLFGELPFVTPEYFGAVGDGITDDTDAIQSALNCNLPKNGYILFSPKIYCISDTLVVTNKNIIFNNCTLKRIANCTVLKFNDSKNFVLSNVTIEDNGETYGTAIIGRNCSNVTIENVSIVLKSPHTDTSPGNWATNLSGDRFHIKGLYINTWDAELWGDGLHFTYVTNSTIEDFVIISGDDSIAITEHEKGGTEFANITSENVRFINGTLKSRKASIIRLGFDNSGLRTTEEIVNIYRKNITFENINSEGRYFLREEVIKHNTDFKWTSDSDIIFKNVKYKNTENLPGTGYHYFHSSDGYSFHGWRFTDCQFEVGTEQVTENIGFFQLGGDIVGGDIILSNCILNLTCKLFSNCNIDSVTLQNSKVTVYDSNGMGRINLTAFYIYDTILKNANSEIVNYAFTASSAKDLIDVYVYNSIIIGYKILLNNLSTVNMHVNNLSVSENNVSYNYYKDGSDYNNLRFGNKNLMNNNDMFVYIPANGTLTIDCSNYIYAKITPLYGNETNTEEIIYKISVGHMIGTSEKQIELSEILANNYISLSVSDKVLTITNLANRYNNCFLKLYSQTN